ncbi:testicular acid phosphatase homolog [Phymastichus coffea]|uniref:testicular acid phosphatase homolog n=1 Tax=Phymastichus coffea TaxID=108790 RepID=UPI00273C273E|nr:testicular acid phosphatase homolog [Phymastichus coffea]XP_058801328.1 testicular acid phosphatase homolog [Phymastichus coffea]
MLVHLCLILYNAICTFGTNIDANLELVQVLFRHGDRTPLEDEASLLPQFNNSYEPWGFARLTKKGMIQEYELGKILRERYNDFLSNMYRPQNVYAYSSNTDRTIASLQLVLAALYTPVGEQKWNDDLNWIPIPIHTVPRFLDILTHSRDCPKYLQKLKEVFNSEYMKSSQLDAIVRATNENSKTQMSYGLFFGITNLLKIRVE